MTNRLLTAADEIRLARRIEQGDPAAKDEMVVCNLRLVHSLAAGYSGRGVPFEDLVQEGTVGLMRAIQKFDHRRGLRFSTYATWWIRRSLVDAVGDSRTIRIPVGARRQMAAIQRARAELRQIGPGAPSGEAIARRAGLSTRRVASLEAAARVTVSLDEPAGDDLAPLGEFIADPAVRPVGQQSEDRDTRRQLWRMLKLLPERQREVVVRRYGLLGDQRQTHVEIGARIGVGEERSRQLEREALHRLRDLAGRAPLAA